VATEFYEANCVGCQHRRPTGQLPNLASLVEERNRASATAAAAAEDELARRHAEWLSWVAQRQAMVVGAGTAMASARPHELAVEQRLTVAFDDLILAI
jgi:hypothetical protein